MNVLKNILIIVISIFVVGCSALNPISVSRYDSPNSKREKYYLTNAHCGFVYLKKENIGLYERAVSGGSDTTYFYNMNENPVSIQLRLSENKISTATVDPHSRVSLITGKAGMWSYITSSGMVRKDIIVNNVSYERYMEYGPNKHASYTETVSKNCKAPKDTQGFMDMVVNPPDKERKDVEPLKK